MKRIFTRFSVLLFLMTVLSAMCIQPVNADIITGVEESSVTKLLSISSTGKQAFNTGYTHKANTQVVLYCNVTKDHASNWEALLGGRLGSYKTNAFCFFSRTDGNDVPCFNRSGNEPRGKGFVYGEDIKLVCEGTTATWYRMSDLSTAAGSVTTTGTADAGKTPMLLFNLNTSSEEGGVKVDTSPSVMTLYACNIFEDGTHVCEFIPAEYNGVVGLYDRKNKTFSGSLTNTAFVGTSAKKYNINLDVSDGGKVITNVTQSRADNSVSLWRFLKEGYSLQSFSMTDANGKEVEQIPIAGATTAELLSNGTCDGTYNGWTKTNGGSGWDIGTDVLGTCWWESSYYPCTLSQTVTLADFGVTDTEIDGGELSCTASASVLQGFNKNGKGASVCSVIVYMLDASGSTLSNITVFNDLNYSSVWSKPSTTFKLVSGTRQLKYEVKGQDAVGWKGQYGPGFKDLSLQLHKSVATIEFDMPASDVTIKAVFAEGTLEKTDAPVISYETNDDACVVTATGAGIIKLYADGVEVENPYTVARGDADKTITFTATAQEDGKAISDLTAMDITVPKKESGSSAYTGEAKFSNIYYYLNGETKTAEVTGSANMYTINIPEKVTYSGVEYTVTGIADNAFSSYTVLTTVTLPNSMTYIGNNAFHGCTALTSINIPNSITSIGENAFSGCESLAAITLPENLTAISDATFYATAISSITIPNSVTSISHYAFGKCKNLTSVTLSDNLTYIGVGAFENSGLTSITLPNSLTQIGNQAFLSCPDLKEIHSEISEPFNIFNTTFDESVFANSTLYVPAGTKSTYQVKKYWNKFANIEETGGQIVKAEIDGIWYNLYMSDNMAVATYKDGSYNSYSGDVVIPEKVVYNGAEYNVTMIERNAFRSCSELTSVIIPQSITIIGDSAFYECKSLASVKILDAPVCIRQCAFANCTFLKKLALGNNVTKIQSGAFKYCGIKILIIPQTVTEIGEAAFYRNNHFVVCSNIMAPFNIDTYAFDNNNSRTLYVPVGTKSIYESTDYWNKFNKIVEGEIAEIENSDGKLITYFLHPESKTASVTLGCSEIYSGDINIPETVTSNGVTYTVNDINSDAFERSTSLTSVTIPESVTSIDDYLFYGCTALTSVTIPESVTSIGNQAFYGCTALTSVTIPESVTSIGNQAFYVCTSLSDVTIQGATSIGSYAFSECAGLTSVSILSSLTSIGYSAFYRCTSLTNVTIPDGVTTIEDWAFAECESLTSVTIPKGLTSIKNSTFYRCTSLTNVTIPDGVTTIEDWAFGECESLTSVTIPKGLTSIKNSTFYKCSSLTNVTIPDGVTVIEKWAFGDCASLTSVNIPDAVTSIGEYAFCRTAIAEIIIPESVTSIGTYTFAMTGITSVTIPASVTSLGDNPFYGCDDLASITVESGNTVYDSRNNCNAIIESASNKLISACKNTTIPNNVTAIGNDAYGGLSWLTSIDIPNTVTTIGDWAFEYCDNLTSITIPESVTKIGEGCFESCTSLKDVHCLIKTPFEIVEDVFDADTYTNATLYVPIGTKSAYQSTNYWNKFANIVEEDPTGIMSIFNGDTTGVNVYDLRGQKINPSQMRKGGVYIINGKKVIVK